MTPGETEQSQGGYRILRGHRRLDCTYLLLHGERHWEIYTFGRQAFGSVFPLGLRSTIVGSGGESPCLAYPSFNRPSVARYVRTERIAMMWIAYKAAAYQILNRGYLIISREKVNLYTTRIHHMRYCNIPVRVFEASPHSTDFASRRSLPSCLQI